MANSKGNTGVILSIVGVAAVLTVVLVLITRKSKKIDQLAAGQVPPAAAGITTGAGAYKPPYTPPYVANTLNAQLGIKPTIDPKINLDPTLLTIV